MNIFLLLDHKEYYGSEKSFSEAQDLIKNIPSVTLLNYISGFSVNLYLNENTEHTGKIQFMLIDNLLSKCGDEAKKKWVSVVKLQAEKGHSPIMLWGYSNLIFYGLIFKTFNHHDSRDLTDDEAQKVFDAYLIVNSIVNSKIEIEAEEIKRAAESDKIEEVVMPNFIYQKDYASSTDFSNQVTRGVKFFEYLESHAQYNSLVKEYYQSKHISGHLRMFKNLMVLFAEIKLDKDLQQRNQLANLEEYYIGKEVDLEYIEKLCVNSEITNYEADQSFGILRNKFLYKVSQFKFLILDVNFLLDQFYKAQIFSFNSFLKTKGIKNDFLSEKGKDFMEEIYLPDVLKTCFPHYITFFGDDCLNSSKEELCDAYLRNDQKICLIEFKDVLLNASAKNSAKKETLFAEFDKKFVANQTNKPKGITQLINAIKDIENHAVSFDTAVSKTGIEIFPVIMYTDFSFGVEGVNKIYREKFRKGIDALNLKKLNVKDVTFININFFELREDYFSQKLMDLFVMLDGYHQHTNSPDYSLTPFEVFSRFYMKNYVPQVLGVSSSYLKHQHDIVVAK